MNKPNRNLTSIVSYPERGTGGNNRYRGNCSPKLIEDAFWIKNEQQPSSPSPYRDLSPCFTWAECLANC